MRVPEALKLRVGVTEVRRSLRTYSPPEARSLAAVYAMRVTEVFQVIETSNLTRENARNLVQQAFAALANEVDGGFLPHTSRPDLERLEQACLAAERLNQLSEALAEQRCSRQAALLADTILANADTSLAELSAERQADLEQGMTRALIEQQRLFLFRMSERLLPWLPIDALFRDIDSNPHGKGASILHSAKPSEVMLGPTVGEAVEAYLAYGTGRWTPKTLKGRQRMLTYLVDHLSAGKPLAEVSSHDVRNYRDGIKRLRSNHHKGPRVSFAARQTDNLEKQIAPKTALLIFEPCKAFWKWCKGVEGYISADPSADVKIDLPPKKGTSKSRRPFSAGELEVLFSAPVFSGRAMGNRRFVAGPHIFKDAYYWLPILGYYTGCRLGELVQLHVDDVQPEGNFPHFLITDEGGGKIGTGTEKHVKSAAGVRRVPMHPHLLELGFLEFVKKRQKSKKPRLFSEIKFGADQQASTVYSKWFGRLLDSVGITDPTLVFHSFRHGAEDAFRNSLQQQYVIDQIIGHTSDAISSQYGQGISLETAYSAVEKMQLPYDLRKSLL